MSTPFSPAAASTPDSDSAFLLELHIGEIRCAKRPPAAQSLIRICAPSTVAQPLTSLRMRAHTADVSLYILPWRMQVQVPLPAPTLRLLQ